MTLTTLSTVLLGIMVDAGRTDLILLIIIIITVKGFRIVINLSLILVVFLSVVLDYVIPQLTSLAAKSKYDVGKIAYYAGCISANSRPYQLCWGNR